MGLSETVIAYSVSSLN